MRPPPCRRGSGCSVLSRRGPAPSADCTAPLVVEDVPTLALEAGQIRVKVEASGLCHTAIHAAHGDWPVKPSPAFVPGHEGVGIDGGFGEFATACARYVVKVPDGIDPFDAAPLTFAGVTTYKAVNVAGTRTDLREVFELHAAGKPSVIRERRPLASVNEAIADVEAGRVAARVVLEP